jgi:GT2 family glycosyltransferase
MPSVPELAFVMSPRQNYFFRELVEAIRFELAEQGIVSVIEEGFADPSPNRVYVLAPPHEYVALEGEVALPAPELLARTLFLCAEQPGTVHFDQNVELARRAGAVFDINPRSVELFNSAGIPARQLGLGHTRYWDHFDDGDERDIDVLFLGSHSPRRVRALNRYGPTLSRWNCHLQISDNSAPNVMQSTSFLAEGKWDLLSRTKVLINIHQGEEPYFEWLRAVDAIHCGAVLVTEHSSGFVPLVPGRDMFVGEVDSLAEIADVLLSDPDRLADVRRSAHEFLVHSMPFSGSVSEFLGAARNLLAKPIPPEVATGQRSAWIDPPASVPAVDPQQRTSDLLRAGLKDARLDLQGMKRQLARIEATLRSPRMRPPPPAEQVFRSRAWEATREPTVSVVTALYNYADLVPRALDSLAASSFGSFEAVIVDDGSGDGSVEAVLEWSAAHPDVALQLVRHPINRGLGAARNTATDFARGAYCFVLDADNILYPRCLAALAATLDTNPSATFAYPILEAFGMVDSYVAAGGSPLVSYHGWDPQRLRRGNYIDALSMIRTRDLRELGGYTTDRRLFGWEDYDLWCRVAESGRFGILVPQILARYRASPNSMRSLTDLFGGDAMSAVIERNPKLMEGVTLP